MTRIFVKDIQTLAPSQPNVSMKQTIFWDRFLYKTGPCGENVLKVAGQKITQIGCIVKIVQ